MKSHMGNHQHHKHVCEFTAYEYYCQQKKRYEKCVRLKQLIFVIWDYVEWVILALVISVNV